MTLTSHLEPFEASITTITVSLGTAFSKILKSVVKIYEKNQMSTTT